MDAASSKRFATCFLLGFALMCMGVVTLHVLGNPDNIFPSPIVPSRNERSWKARRLQVLLAEGRPPQIVVMGSSRVMQMSPYQIEAITGKRTFNYAVPGASLADNLAQLRYLLRLGIKPQMLIVGVEERGLLGLYERWEGLALEDWNLFRQKPLIDQVALAGKAISQIQFEHTLLAIGNLIRRPALDQKTPQAAVWFLCDNGYAIYGRKAWARQLRGWDPQLKVKEVARLGKSRAERNARLYSRARLDIEQWDDLLAMLRLCKAKRIKVKLVMTPLQPDYQQIIVSRAANRRIAAIAKQLQSKCAELRCEFYDFRDIRSFDGLAHEFWDGVHCTPDNMRKLVNRMFGLPTSTTHRGVPDDVMLIQNPPAINSLTTW